MLGIKIFLNDLCCGLDIQNKRISEVVLRLVTGREREVKFSVKYIAIIIIKIKIITI